MYLCSVYLLFHFQHKAKIQLCSAAPNLCFKIVFLTSSIQTEIKPDLYTVLFCKYTNYKIWTNEKTTQNKVFIDPLQLRNRH